MKTYENINLFLKNKQQTKKQNSVIVVAVGLKVYLN